MGTIIQPEHHSQGSGHAFELKEVPNALARSIAATKVEYRRVESSGLIVSNPILGTLGQGGSSIHIHQYSSWWIEVDAESAEFSLIDGMLIHEAQWLMDMELS
ncbi:hypothetical protein PG989_001185 [Apiospora arundinis]